MAATAAQTAAKGGHVGDASTPASAAGTTAEPPPTAPSPAAVAWPSRDACLYTSCYCEENIYLLARELVDQLPPSWRLFAVFVSNPRKTVPLWRQRSAAAPSMPVLWDYHVLLLAQLGEEPPLVFDLDSTLPFPCSLHEYHCAALLGDDSSLAPQYRRCYRVVPARLLLRHFASDRSHMVGQGGKGWLASPPPWPCLVAESGATNTLPAYLDFTELGGPDLGGSHSGEEPAGSSESAGSVERQRQRQQQQQQRQQRQQQQQQGGWRGERGQPHGGTVRDGGLAIPSEGGLPFGVVLREPAFLQLFGVNA